MSDEIVIGEGIVSIGGGTIRPGPEQFTLSFEPEAPFGVFGYDPPVDVFFGVSAVDMISELFTCLEVLTTEVTPVMALCHHTSTFGSISNDLLDATDRRSLSILSDVLS